MVTIAFLVMLASCGGGKSTGSDTAPLVTPSGPAGSTGPTLPASDGTVYGDLRTGNGKLMLHQRGALAVTPTGLRDRLATMDTTLDAFSGVFLRMPATSGLITMNAPVALAAITADLAPVAALKPVNLRFNFAVVSFRRDLDPFDDWSVVVANFTNLAKAAKAAGLVGIVIDNESASGLDNDPSGLRVNYPADVKFPGRSVDEYRARTQLVSKQIMQAMVVEFPQIAVVVMRGPAGGEQMTSQQMVPPLNGTRPTLLGSFFAGFVEGKGSTALVVDGGDDYGLRIDDQFAASSEWRKTGIASTATNSAVIPAALRSAWPTSVNVSFGVREIDGYLGQTLANVQTVWENTVSTALRQSDTFAWASFDSTDMSSAAASNAFVVSAKRAKAAAISATNHLASQVAASGTGLMAQYFNTADQTYLMQTRVDAVIDNSWSVSGPVGTVIAVGNPPRQDNVSVVWSGYLEAPTTGTYLIFGSTDDGMRITVGGVTVVDAMFDQGTTEYSDGVLMQGGVRYPIKVEWFQHGGGAEAHVAWTPPGGAKAIIPVERLYPTN